MKRTAKITTAMCIIGCTLITLSAQTLEKPNKISVGSSKQSYNGDLGNAWLDFKEEYYGNVVVDYQRYLNQNFNLKAFASYGDIGRCRMEDDELFWPDGTEILNMRVRMTTLNLNLKYKFANDKILPSTSSIKPYAAIGLGLNHMGNVWEKPRVRLGTYASANASIGVDLALSQRFSLNYNLGMAYLSNDKMDFKSQGSNDMYLQGSLMMGYHF